jgi:hypothetical protein
MHNLSYNYLKKRLLKSSSSQIYAAEARELLGDGSFDIPAFDYYLFSVIIGSLNIDQFDTQEEYRQIISEIFKEFVRRDEDDGKKEDEFVAEPLNANVVRLFPPPVPE